MGSIPVGGANQAKFTVIEKGKFGFLCKGGTPIEYENFIFCIYILTMFILCLWL